MNNAKLKFAGLALLFAAAVSVACVCIRAAAPIAMLTAAEGIVEVRRTGSAKWFPASEGMQLYAGDALRTKKDSTATLMYNDGTISRLTRNASFTLKKPAAKKKPAAGESPITARLWGRLNASARKKENSLPTAIAGVGGGAKYSGVLGSIEESREMEKREMESLSVDKALRGGEFPPSPSEEIVPPPGVNIPLMPSNTALPPGGALVFLWETRGVAPGTATYTYVITLNRGDEQLWAATSTLPMAAYPASAPALTPGATYTWQVTAVDETGFTPAIMDIPAEFTVSPGIAPQLAELEAALTAQKADAETASLLRGALYQENGLLLDALFEYTALADGNPASQLFGNLVNETAETMGLDELSLSYLQGFLSITRK